MLIYLCQNQTVQVVRNPAADKYIKHAFGIIREMNANGLCGINNHSKWYMVMTYEDRLLYPELYGFNNSCRALFDCKGRLPSFDNTLCYISGAGGGTENIEITIVDKEAKIFFALALYSSYWSNDVFDTPIDIKDF